MDQPGDSASVGVVVVVMVALAVFLQAAATAGMHRRAAAAAGPADLPEMPYGKRNVAFLPAKRHQPVSVSDGEARKHRPVSVSVPFISQQMCDPVKFPPRAHFLSSLRREIKPRLFEVQVEHAQSVFTVSLCSLRVHLTTKLLDGFTTLLMLSVHVCSCCTCPLCTIDQAPEKLVTKA